MDLPRYETLLVESVGDHVISVKLNRPSKLNSMNSKMWSEILHCFDWIDVYANTCRCVILSGEGRIFSAGADFAALAGLDSDDFEESPDDDIARKALKIRAKGTHWQSALNRIHTCLKPVICCIHSACVGGALELAAATDIRFCTSDSYFQYKEGDAGLAADVGGLQRFPKLVGNDSLVRELVFSGRKMLPEESQRLGFVSRICKDKDAMMSQAIELANVVAAKSPIATIGAKKFLNYSRDHSEEDSLDYAMAWNMAMLQGEDMRRALEASMQKKTPTFHDLPKQKAKL